MNKKCPVDMLNSKDECIISDYRKCSEIKCSARGADFNISGPAREVKLKDFGPVSFGRFKGKKWQELPSKYLEYLISEDCNTSYFNKEKAKVVLNYKNANKGVMPGQLEMPVLKK